MTRAYGNGETRDAGAVTLSSHSARGALLVVVVVALALAVACADDDDGSSAGDAGVPTPAATATATAEPTAMPLPTAVQAAIDQAAIDAGVAADAVELVEYRGEEWSDSALGCPEPGKFYAQVITPGYIVLLDVNGTEREYHTDLGSHVVSCDEAPA